MFRKLPEPAAVRFSFAEEPLIMTSDSSFQKNRMFAGLVVCSGIRGKISEKRIEKMIKALFLPYAVSLLNNIEYTR
jgi:hypothetical protein